jgi:hypothetical protein
MNCLPRRTPRRPCRRMRRSTVQRATAIPSRRSRCHIFLAPQIPRPKFLVPEHSLDHRDEFLISQRPRRHWAGFEGVVTRRGNLDPVLTEHGADRLDPEPVTVIIDERDHHGSRGSSSRAKNEDAANKISLARFSSLTSASNTLILAASTVVTPGRCPKSIEACLAQPRNVSAFTPDPLPNPNDRRVQRQLRILFPRLIHEPNSPIPQLLPILP